MLKGRKSNISYLEGLFFPPLEVVNFDREEFGLLARYARMCVFGGLEGDFILVLILFIWNSLIQVIN